MPAEPKASTGAIAAAVVLSALIALLWIWLMPGLANLSGSDAAGNALSRAFAAIGLIILWVLLGVLILVAWAKGGMPSPVGVVAAILVPISGFAAMAAAELLAHPNVSPFLWPIIIPAGVPPLFVVLSFWALLWPARATPRRTIPAGGILGAIIVVCAAIVPLQQMRGTVIDQAAAAREKYDADFARLPVDAPLWDYAPFLDTPDETKKAAVLARIRRLERRQSDAELMLDRGDFPLRFLGGIDLDPTPTVCEKARGLLRQRVQLLIPKAPDREPYSKAANEVSDALTAMQWLVGYGCSCDEESLAWENMANAYRNPNYDVFELAHLRDPKALGRIVREYPARFSMLSPKSHLKAWLKYADDTALREQALAGARTLDHRNADAVEMLNNQYDISAPWTVLKYMPRLDLEPTASLCDAALKQVQADLTKVYRPTPDDRRPYQELLDRLGVYAPLTALQWLAGNGCNAEAQLSDAEAVVRTYQDSPERAAMLASLARLHRKP
jgi:hypothetical protein